MCVAAYTLDALCCALMRPVAFPCGLPLAAAAGVDVVAPSPHMCAKNNNKRPDHLQGQRHNTPRPFSTRRGRSCVPVAVCFTIQ
jgi:hypothetical protein